MTGGATPSAKRTWSRYSKGCMQPPGLTGREAGRDLEFESVLAVSGVGIVPVLQRTFLTAATETHADHEEHQERSQQALHGESPCNGEDGAGVHRPSCSLPMFRYGVLPVGGDIADLSDRRH